MRKPLDSNWNVDEILANLFGFRRVDDGGDLLAFRIAGSAPGRFVYVYLYGDKPELIHYDLEDVADLTEWDHAVERGGMPSAVKLRQVCEEWLGCQATK